MGVKANSPKEIWNSFTAEERRRIFICASTLPSRRSFADIGGIMFYKVRLYTACLPR